MEKKWWHSAIGYQVYPKSFQDTNHDGIGDLPGITAHLDDLVRLGINVLWLCPVNRSPMMDGGYDISDYDAIDPSFGTMEDFEELVREAGKRGIRILMDVVVNHTSTEHPWFQKALEDPEGAYGDYYVIRRGKNGGPPNGWRSFFGGSAWERIGDTEHYYLHLFTVGQPDLNWENPRVREEIYAMLNRWLDKGIGGFRMDSINHLKKNFQDNGQGKDPFSYCTNVEGIGEFLQEMKDRTYGPRDAFVIGEVNGTRPDQLEEYIGENGYFSTMFDFTCMRYRIGTSYWKGKGRQMRTACRDDMFGMQKRIWNRALPCNVMENHDTPRVVERFYPPEQVNDYSKSMLGAMNFFLGGIPFLYQGQAIGMTDYRKEEISQFRDFTTFRLYEESLEEGISPREALARLNVESREHARTPVQWDDSPWGGFSDREPWFAVNPNYREINLASQKDQADSLFSFYCRMTALRKQADLQDLWIYGETRPFWEEKEDLAAYERRLGENHVCVLCNTSPEETRILLDRPVREILLANYPDRETIPDGAPEVGLSASAPEVKLPAGTPEVGLSASAPGVKLPAGAPEVGLSASAPGVKLPAGTPEVKTAPAHNLDKGDELCLRPMELLVFR